MSNPFLFDDDGVDDATVDPTPNPFLQDAGAENVAEEFDAGENPFFSTQPRKQSTASINPFADYGSDDVPIVTNIIEPIEAESVPIVNVPTTTASQDAAMCFFGTTIKDDDDDDARKRGPPPRPTPPNQATQELISTVSDHLDQTSSHLLGRIPATRTPSPVSVRDLHSPSPTPDMADLLDVDDAPTNVGQSNENPFADIIDATESTPAANEQSVPQPTRPEPPRRPSQPAPQVQPDVVQSHTNEADLFDMFGTSVPAKAQPNVPKTNADIINLYSAPKQPVEEPKPTDLMSSDFTVAPSQPTIVSPPIVSPPIVSLPIVSSAAPPKPPPPRPSRPPAPPIVSEKVHVSQTTTTTAVPAPIVTATVPAVEAKPHVASVESDLPIQSLSIQSSSLTPTNDDKADSLSDQSSAISSNVGLSENPSPYHSAATADYINNSQSPVSRDEIVSSYINQADISSDANPFGAPPLPFVKKSDEFDAFSAKFDSVKKEDTGLLDGFRDGNSGYKSPLPEAAWGASDFIVSTADEFSAGFDDADDGFLSMQAPPEPESNSAINVFIRPAGQDQFTQGSAILAPPPSRSSQNSFYEEPSQTNQSNEAFGNRSLPLSDDHKTYQTSSQQESPSTPLFDDDVSQPLEDFPRIIYIGDGWEMQLRQPTKKKITGQRFWKKVFVRIVLQGDTPAVHILNSAKDKDPFQELPLQACYSVSDISAQPFDQFGKIFTLKLQYIFYKERPGVRPGQVTKAERLTNKLSQFAAYAIQGDYQGVKEFGSDLKKLGLPVEHAPQVSQLVKLGSHNYEDLKQFSVCIEEHLFKFNVHRDRALTYKMEEVQVTGVDEIYVEQSAEGHVLKQIARVRLFLLAFLTGMPTIELGVNDMWRQGKEVVGRHDIIPVATEEWIRLEGVEFHSCVQLNEYERNRMIRFQPPDACYIELMRFRVRPPKNRELPLQLKATWCVTGKRVELRADILVPGFASRKLGQIPCEDVSLRFPIPECWIYLFRVEKHFRYGSVKSAHRRTGKIKGIERILGTVDQLQESLIEVTSGQAKYEHHHRAIVWRCPRLPKEGQGAYTTHQMVVRMALTSYDQIPQKLAEHCFVEFTMPATTVSHTTIRSVSVQDSDSDDPPEKYVRYLARHEYRVGIECISGESENPYLAATAVKKEPVKEAPALPTIPAAQSDSDSDSN